MMKHHWQQQYMAAALRASEEEWDRASSVSGHTSPAIAMGGPSYAQPYPPFPMYGVLPHQQPMPSMPWMFPYPPNPNASRVPGYPQQPGGGGMYGYGTGAHSVFGGDFGVPVITSSRLRSTSTQPPENHRGIYHDPRAEPSLSSSPSNRPKYAPTSNGTPLPPASWRKTDDWEETSTPRKARPSTQVIS